MHIYNLLAILPPYTTLHIHSDTEQWTASVNKVQKDESLSNLKYAKICWAKPLGLGSMEIHII